MIFQFLSRVWSFLQKTRLSPQKSARQFQAMTAKLLFLWPNGAQGKKVLNTPLCGIDWIDDQVFESNQDFSFFKLLNHNWVPLNHGFINCRCRGEHFGQNLLFPLPNNLHHTPSFPESELAFRMNLFTSSTNFLSMYRVALCSGVWSGPTKSLTCSKLPSLLGFAVSA